MRPIGDKLVIATHNPGKLREIAALLEPLGIDLRRRRGARPARAGGDRQHLRRQCRSEGARGGRSVRPARARRRQRAVRRRARRPARHLLGALGRGRGRQPRLRPRDGARLARSSKPPGRTPAATPISSARCRSPGHDGQIESFEGRVDGTLVWPPRGDKGFGYDPMFVPAGHEQTFGEMDPAEKHAISHRAAPSRSWSAAPEVMGDSLALYVHWPFCVPNAPIATSTAMSATSVDQDALARRPARRPRP